MDRFGTNRSASGEPASAPKASPRRWYGVAVLGLVAVAAITPASGFTKGGLPALEEEVAALKSQVGVLADALSDTRSSSTIFHKTLPGRSFVNVDQFVPLTLNVANPSAEDRVLRVNLQMLCVSPEAGHGEINALFKVFLDGQPLGTTGALLNDTNFDSISFQRTVALPPGNHTITVQSISFSPVMIESQFPSFPASQASVATFLQAELQAAPATFVHVP